MSIQEALARVAQIDQMLAPPPVARPAPAPAASPSGGSFATQLSSAATMSLGTAPAAPATSSNPIVAAAQREVGQSEQPPGSNDSPRIAQYRTAIAGSGVGPWCAYFASWASAQAGTPLGEQGQGFGSVGALSDWAQR